MQPMYSLLGLVVLLGIFGCGSHDSDTTSGAPASTVATPDAQQAAQAELGATGTAAGKEDVPTAGMAPNSPGNEMPADTSK
ncbi:MAG: hypothetical protein QE269_13505, partial [Fimbriimonas sp.]|nr:hypothetical protein [Fimbriimonas sp.]